MTEPLPTTVRTRFPFLVLLGYYGLVVVAGARAEFSGDENFYLEYARALATLVTGGDAHLNLGTGPGYPLALLPFVAGHVPLLWCKLANAGWLLGAVLYLHAALRLYLPRRAALGFALVFGLYPPLLKESFYLLSECLAMFCMCAFLYHFCRLHQRTERPGVHRLAAGLFAGWLILTKVFFSYVFLSVAVLAALLWVVRRRSVYANAVAVAALAFVACLPYLAYTYSVTGRPWYWAYTGGEALYWMSTPYAGEYGEWHPSTFRDIERLRANHGPVFDALPSDRAAREEGLRQRAIRNIREHPGKYAINWVANVGRMVFSYPFSYRLQTPLTLLLIVPNAFVFVLTVLCVYPSVRARSRLPPEMGLLLLFAAIAFGGASLLAAYERQFRVLVPILTLWIAFTLTEILRIEFRSAEPAAPTAS